MRDSASLRFRAALAIICTALATSGAFATWSIVIIDRDTKEIALGSATCLTNFDLQKGAGIMLVEVGAGQAQSAVDTSGKNRKVIWDQLKLGTEPRQIIRILSGQDSAHQSRQYGIGDTLGRTTTFTGTGAGKWRGGLTGEYESLVYAIQGNVLTGEVVITEAEKAIRDPATDGDLPAKLMAAMEAARSMGGDGRCSCDPDDPERCGVPPKQFTKAAHIGYMVIARAGDKDGTCSQSTGCVNGDYYLNFNIAFQNENSEDPVKQMIKKFQTFRTDEQGHPDAVRSSVQLSSDVIAPDGTSTVLMTITVRDWQQVQLGGGLNVAVEHAPDSAGITQIDDVVDNGDGTYTVLLTAGTTVGVDRFWVTVDDGGRAARIMPSPTLTSCAATFDYPLGRPDLVLPGGATRLYVGPHAVGEHAPFDHLKLVIVGDGGEIEFPMSPANESDFQVEFPAAECGSGVKYYVRATNGDGDVSTDPLNAPTDTYTSRSGSSIEARFADDFEKDLGWTTEVNGATSGKWQRAAPINDVSYKWAPHYDSDFSGSCWLTDNRRGESDVDGGPPRLISPTLDMTGGWVEVHYDYFARLSSSGGKDRLQVDGSDDDGQNWVELTRHNTDSADWHTNVIDHAAFLAAGLTPGEKMKLRFQGIDESPDSTAEFAVDAFRVDVIHCELPGPRGDLDCDGNVDFNDIDAFVAALGDEAVYEAENPGCVSALADLNCDAVIDFGDVDRFVDCLIAGGCSDCP